MSAVKEYNKFLFYDEYEPPEKKIVSDGDLLIKKLAEKQRNTEVNLKEQLLKPKLFEKSTNLVALTNSGKYSLKQFEEIALRSEELEQFRLAGLSHEDIQLVLDFRDGTLFEKHRNFELTLLKDRINKLNNHLEKFYKREPTERNKFVQKRQITQFGLSIKPESSQTKLLRFALQNETKESNCPHPMNNIKEIEQKLLQHLQTRTEVPNNIQKKLRKLARRVDGISNKSNVAGEEQNLLNNNIIKPFGISYVRNSKWDKKEVTVEAKATQEKIFTCKPCNYYTIKDGEITKLSDNEAKNKITISKKLSLNEIKNLPKFGNYEVGLPSKILYAKNLPRIVTESDLKNIFSNYNKNKSLSFRIMTGRMKGQAFITFPDVCQATAALEDLNGTVLNNRPIILQFGRQNK